jgi:SnoaL-like protein
MTITTTQLAERLERAFKGLDLDSVKDLYDAKVVLDAHVPGWRFQLQGPDALLGWWNETVSHMPKPRTVWTRATPTADGAIVEWELRIGDDDESGICREIDVFHTDGERITEHVLWCGGMWDHDTIVRQKAEAPMVRWYPEG